MASSRRDEPMRIRRVDGLASPRTRHDDARYHTHCGGVSLARPRRAAFLRAHSSGSFSRTAHILLIRIT